VFFGIFGIVDGAISIGAVFYIVIISIIIAFIILLVVFGTYFRKINLIRVVVNFISMVTISILYLLQTLKINSTSQNLAIPIIGLVLLYTVVFINFAVVVRI
jgi:cytochrome c biogenesis factor